MTIAVTKSTSRSSSSGNDTTVSENRISDSAAPTALPMARNNSPSLVVSTTVMNSCRLENEALSPISSAISSRTWYIQITKTNSVTKAIQPISPRELTVDQMRANRDRLPGLAAAAQFIEADRDKRADQRKAGGQRIGQIDHAERGQAEQDHDAAAGIERAEHEPIKRHGLEIAQALPQRFRNVSGLDPPHHRIDLAGDRTSSAFPPIDFLH